MGCMDRRIALTAPLAVDATTAVSVISTRFDDLVAPTTAAVEVTPLNGSRWVLLVAARGRTDLPHFAGELEVVADDDGRASLSLDGAYRLRTRVTDVVDAHLRACDALDGFLTGLGDRVLALTKQKPAPMSTGTTDYAEDFRRRHNVSV